jgi:hypothetical protein
MPPPVVQFFSQETIFMHLDMDEMTVIHPHQVEIEILIKDEIVYSSYTVKRLISTILRNTLFIEDPVRFPLPINDHVIKVATHEGIRKYLRGRLIEELGWTQTPLNFFRVKMTAKDWSIEDL